MPKKPANFEVTCPCCSAVLKIDTETRAVIAHTAAVKPKTFSDMEAAAKAMREQDSRRESIFQQSVEAQKHASDLLEKKFQEALKKAKDPLADGQADPGFDLDRWLHFCWATAERRARKSIPENTFTLFDQALADGCDGFEFDVRLSADGLCPWCVTTRTAEALRSLRPHGSNV